MKAIPRRRARALALAAVASVAAGVVLPSVAIGRFALADRRAEAISDFALAVAEPPGGVALPWSAPERMGEPRPTQGERQ